MQKAQERRLPYDCRTVLGVVQDLKKEGVQAYPFFYPKGACQTLRTIGPLAGISRQMTVLCNECGRYTIYGADEHGFNNPPGVWPRRDIDLGLIGDSFAQGACVSPENNLAALIRRRGKTVLSLGSAGIGPLAEYAITVEYVKVVRPKTVMWLYFEGNDLDDLEEELTIPILNKYLKDGFSQNLINRQDEIDEKLIDSGKYYYNSAQQAFIIRQLQSLFTLEKIRINYHKVAKRYHEKYYIKLTATLINRANNMVSSWGGKLFFVYLPSYDRYMKKVNDDKFMRRSELIALILQNGIQVIDFHETMINDPDPLSFFPFRVNGHYSEAGYKKLANTIINHCYPTRPLHSGAAGH
ncbi:MAG: hypothetical protein WC600_10670 [Desulfobaccales bacterium]